MTTRHLAGAGAAVNLVYGLLTVQPVGIAIAVLIVAALIWDRE